MTEPHEGIDRSSEDSNSGLTTASQNSVSNSLETSSGPRVGHLNSIDFLRGAAALGVVVFHASHAASHNTTDATIARLHELSRYGAYGVPLFFVISGFCIHRKQAERTAAGVDDSIPFLKYWKRRFFRLYPSYFTVCVGSALLLAVAIATGANSKILDTYPGNKYLYLALDFLTHIFLLHSFFPLFDRGLGNGSLWTLAREEQYYLLYFPLLKLKRYAGIWICLLLSMIVSFFTILIAERVSGSDPGVGHLIGTSSLALWPQWVLGMLGMELLVNRSRLIKLCGNRSALVAGLAIFIWQKEFPGPEWFHVLMLGFAFFLVITSLSKIEMDGGWSRSLWAQTFERIGRYSYSLYLIHYPVLVILSRPARAMGSNANLVSYFIFMAFAIAVSNLAGYVLYYLVERHGQSKPA